MAAERILIVDDDAESVSLIGSVLERQGYSISKAFNGPMALDRAQTDHPALILLDIMMPDMDGFEVATQLRDNPATAQIPIIIFTAKGMTEDKITGFEVGADDYLTKPTHPAELLARIKSVLARSSTRISSQRVQPVNERGSIVGFVGAKGGLGTTTLALNSAVAMALGANDTTITLAELNPGQGMIGLLLNMSTDRGLSRILEQEHPILTPQYLEECLVSHTSGLRLFLSSSQPSPNDSRLTSDVAIKLADALAPSGTTLFIDMGSGLDERKRWLLPLLAQIIIVIEPERIAFLRASQMVDEIKKMGIDDIRISVVLVNRTPVDTPIPLQNIQEALKVTLLAVIAPASELARQATDTGVPMVILHPESLPSAQIVKLSEILLERLRAGG
jgi:CheY-like chemotaxis protein/MinD-like ATPase involved in chromosome partitioning or flagellar assembly